jgi:DNA replication protein DnaC
VDAAYEKRSVPAGDRLFPRTCALAGFDELMPKTLATATVDRLLHHAHVCQTSGDSIRLTQALGPGAGKGVTCRRGRNAPATELKQSGPHDGQSGTDDSVTNAVARILRAELVVIDDIVLLPVATEAAEGLYRVVDAAYEKRSAPISSNLRPAGFDELMPKTLATATVDRLLHHAHVCQTSGDSIRLTQALAGKGVTQLN